MARKKLSEQAKNRGKKRKMNRQDDIVKDDKIDGVEQQSTESVEEDCSCDKKLKDLTAEVMQWKDKYFRTMAEFENYRRRTIKEKSDWLKNSNERMILSICDVMDNFERAMGQMQDDHTDDPFITGIIQIKQQMDSLLEKENVVKLESLDQEFDPAFHEALAHIPSDKDENIVTAVIQNGYKMNDKIIRPARVAVSNGQEPQINKEQNK